MTAPNLVYRSRTKNTVKWHWRHTGNDLWLASACSGIRLAAHTGRPPQMVPVDERCAGIACHSRWSAWDRLLTGEGESR